MKDFQDWSHMSTTTTVGNYMKKKFPSLPRNSNEMENEKKKRKKTRKAIAKFFAFHAKPIINQS